MLIADVDCTVEEALCERYDIGGFPTLQYFTPATGPKGEKYTGDRFIEDLEEFVRENLLKGCNVGNLEGCSDKERDYIKKMQAKGVSAISKEKKRLQGLVSQGMTPDKQEWMSARVALLRQLESNGAKGADEL